MDNMELQRDALLYCFVSTLSYVRDSITAAGFVVVYRLPRPPSLSLIRISDRVISVWCRQLPRGGIELDVT